ncbi:hypothetical protein AB833_19410 [Chromatiales bacterium (ex Bugula neritina AB1)]|nr:hypothetical protein AB833_19410 [Chromatiales bacterium (ex Bugula neritina AB1)]
MLCIVVFSTIRISSAYAAGITGETGNSVVDSDDDGIADVIEEPASPRKIAIADWPRLSVGVTVAGSGFITPEAVSDWNSQINSAPISNYIAGDRYRVSWELATSPVGGNQMVGLGVDESGSGFDDIEYAFYSSSGRVYIYESGRKAAQVGFAVAGTTFAIEVDSDNIRYFLDNNLVRSTTAGDSKSFYIDASFYRKSVNYSNFNVSEIPANPDVDGDGVGNAYDLDSDNDSIADVVEAGLIDHNRDYKADVDATPGAVTDPPDSDRDGVPDYLDSESLNPLNDGTAFDISNTAFAHLDSNGDGAITAFDRNGGNDANANGIDDLLEDADQDGINNIADPDDDNDGIPDAVDALPLDPSEITDRDGDGVGDNTDIDLDNDGLADSLEEPPLPPRIPIDDWVVVSDGVNVSGNSFISPAGVSNWDAQVNSVRMSALGFSGDFEVSWSVAGPVAGSNQMIGLGLIESGAGFNDIDFAFYNSAGRLLIYESGNSIGRFGSVVAGTRLAIQVQAGSIRYLVDGRVVHTSVNNDGTDFYIDTSFFRGAVHYGDFAVSELPANTDADSDGIVNSIDLDSDNDTIPDVIEAGLADVNHDLQVDSRSAQGSVSRAPDSDGDGIADYLDAESHNALNDGSLYDIQSSAFAVLDSNGDGKLDSADQYGGIDANANGIDDLQEDPDRDGLYNNIDPDDDNDGVPDAIDALPYDPTDSVDSDGDGVGDSSDIDTDNDGIPDTSEFQPMPEPVPLTQWVNASTGVAINGSGFTSPAGTTDWSAQINSVLLSTLGFDGNFKVSWSIADSPGNGNQMVGLGVNESGPGWSDIEYAFHNNAGRIFAYRDGRIVGQFGTVSSGTEFSIELKNNSIRYRIDNKTVYTTTHRGDSGFYIDASFFRGTVSYADFQLTEPDLNDIDEDGIANISDLDSDNDTIPDIVEAGLADLNYDLLVDTIFAQGSVAVPPDSDGDGIPDFLDIESHNPENDGTAYDIDNTVFGVLDTNGDGQLNTQDRRGGLDTNSNGLADYPEDADQDGVHNTLDTDDDNDGVPDVYDDLRFDPSDSADSDADGVGDNSDIDTDNDGLPDAVEQFEIPETIAINQWSDVSIGVSVAENGFTSPAGSANWNSQINSAPMSSYGLSDNYRVSWQIGTTPIGGNQMIGLGQFETGPQFSDIEYAFYNRSGQLLIYEAGRYEGAFGSINSGATLSIEVGTGVIRYLVNNSVVRITDYTIGADFYIDSSFFRGATGFTGFTVAALDKFNDADADGIANVLDLDSDNDTIPDVIEAGLSDINSNSLVDFLNAQGSVWNPPDSDADGLPDYLDLESHNAANDGSAYDIANSAFAKLDINADGQLNAKDSVAGADENLNGVGDHTEDPDGDGLANAVDPDDDNDGVADYNDALPFDATESNDLDGDGVGDNSDFDTDNDGIADILEEPPAPAPVAVDRWRNVSSGIIVFNNAFASPAGSGNWNTQLNSVAFSEYGFTDHYRLSWVVDSLPTGSTQMIGLGIDESSAAFDDIEFAFYNSSGRLYGYESGVNTGELGRAVEGTILSLEVDGRNIRYIIDGVVVRSTTTAIESADYYIDTSFFRGAVKLGDISLVRLHDVVDIDGDGITNAYDLDSDNDSIADVIEAGLSDINGDYMVDTRAEQGSVTRLPDSDSDGIPDFLDLESHSAQNEGLAYDIDRTALSQEDINNDGRLSHLEGLGDENSNGVDDRLEDIDGDGLVNIIDTDDDNDGVLDGNDDLPFDSAESTDSDGDGVGDNTDRFPFDATESLDDDRDGTGNNTDVFPLDPLDWSDTDNDGVGDNSDYFPEDPTEVSDQDLDGVGDVADIDADNDGIADTVEEVPPPPASAITQWVNVSSGVVIEGDNLTSPEGGNSWTAQANSVPMSSYNLFDNYRISWVVSSSPAGSNQMIGLGVVESSTEWSDIDYAFYNSAGNLFCFDRGIKTAYAGRVEVGTELALEADSGQMRYVVNGKVVYTATYSGVPDFYIDSAFFRGAVRYSEFAFSRLGENPDRDADNISNANDLDSDNDTIPDVIEAGGLDLDGNLMVDSPDAQGSVSAPVDSDRDGIADYLDLESHNAANDGTAFDIQSGEYSVLDTNGNGRIDQADGNGAVDANRNGIDDRTEDTDKDGIANDIDDDDDNDGVTDMADAFPDDNRETQDSDGDGRGDNRDLFPADPGK